MFLKRILLVVYLSFSFFSFSQSIQLEKEFIEINNENQQIDIFENLHFFKEKGNTDFDLKRLEKAEFYKPKKLYYYLKSLNKETFWMRCTLKNNVNKDFIYYYILRHSYLYKGTVYIVNNNNVSQLHNYNYQSIKKENTYSSFPTWKINLPKKEEITIYIKVYQSGGRTKITGLLKGEKDFLKYNLVSFGIHSAFGLFIFFVFIFCLYTSKYTKKRFVIFYGLYAFFVSLDYFCIHGVGKTYFWTENLFLVKNTRSISNAACAFFLSLFFAFFYGSHQYPKWIKKVFLFLAFIFGTFLTLYVVKFFNGGFRSLFLYVWKTMSFLIVIVLFIHCYLFYKKAVPLYVLVVFIIHLVATFFHKNTIFPYSTNIFLDWFIFNIPFVTLSLEIIVLTYFIFKSLKKEKISAEKLEVEFQILQKELTIFKEQYLNKKEPIHNTVIHLKSNAILNSTDILYVKSDGHYVEYFLDTKTTPEIDRNSLNEVLKILPTSSFIRIHKSFIVNIHHIKIINSTKVMLDNGVWINLSRTYKQQLKDILHKVD